MLHWYRNHESWSPKQLSHSKNLRWPKYKISENIFGQNNLSSKD